MRQERFTATSGAHEQDIGLGELDLRRGSSFNALIVVVHSHRQNALGVFLTNDVIIQHFRDLAGNGNSRAFLAVLELLFFADDVCAKVDAFITDEHGGACN